MLGPGPGKLRTVVLELCVIDVLLGVTAVVPVEVPALADNVKVTPAGTPLNVNRMFVPLVTGVPLLELCVDVRNADAKPSVMTKEAAVSGIDRLVKIVAVPLFVPPARAPIAMLPMPGPIALITVALVVVRM